MKKISSSIVLAILIISFAIIFISFDEPKEAIDFNNAVDLAMKNNTDLIKAKNEYELAKLSYNQALANLYYPSISFSSSINTTTGSSSSSSYSAGIGLSKPIYNGLSLLKAKDMALANLQYKKSLYEIEKQVTIYSTYSKYYTYIYDLICVYLLTEMSRINKIKLDEYTEQYRLGMITELSLLSMQLSASKVDLSLKEAKGKAQQDYLQLKNYLNLKEDFVLVYDKEAVKKDDFSKIFYDNQDSDLLEKFDTNYLEDAKTFSESVNSYYFSYKQAELNLKYHIASLFPSLAAELGISFGGNLDQSSSSQNLKFSLSLSFDLDSILPFSSTSFEKKIMEKEYENAKLAFIQAVEDLKINLASLKDSLQLSMDSLEDSRKSYDYAKKGYNLAESAFNEGQLATSDFITWQQDYIDAKISYIDAMLDYQILQRQILAAIGKLVY
jgi:outer membrane protein TolC